MDEFASPAQKRLANLEYTYGCHNYHPLPVVLSRGKAHEVWDVDGNRYLDALSAYSAVGQGHNHPKIVDAMIKQAQTLALTSRAFYNDVLGEFEKRVTEIFGYERVLPMNSGAEAVESAVKISRRWGYRVKRIPKNQARLIFMRDNFHGRTTLAVSASTDPDSFTDFGPFVPNLDHVTFGDADELDSVLRKHGDVVAAVVLEPIQGEAGIKMPPAGYLRRVRDLCTQHKVLMVADEIQTGLGRTGTMLRCDAEGVRPDIVTLGKALSGGLYPISAVLADSKIMDVLDPGSHGSTFGGNPIAARVGLAALDVLVDEKLPERARVLGERFRSRLSGAVPDLIANGVVVRGAGLLNAVVVPARYSPAVGRDFTAMDVCLRLLRKHGVLAKPTHGDIIRIAPPLVIPESALDEIVDAIVESLRYFSSGSSPHASS